MARVKRGVQAHAKHKKVIDQAKVIAVDAKTSIGLRPRPLPKQVNTRIGIDASVNVKCARFGSSESTRRPASAV